MTKLYLHHYPTQDGGLKVRIARGKGVKSQRFVEFAPALLGEGKRDFLAVAIDELSRALEDLQA